MPTKISIIVPCYNQAQYLDECLQSVLDQTYRNWECIVVNDGSPDNTEELALQWTAKDPRFIYLKKENGGLSSARNVGIEMAKGDWIQFLDCDDKISPEKFSKNKDCLSTTDICISQFQVLFQSQLRSGYCQLTSDMFSFENILLHWGKEISIPIHCGLFKKELLLDFQFDTRVKSMEDWLMWLHLFNKKPKIQLIDFPLAIYRKENEKSMSGNVQKLFQQKMDLLPTIKQLYGDNHHDQLVYFELKNKSKENFELKNELIKIQKSFVVSTYLKLLKKYYTLKNP